jgi:DNA-directed RNA polymerase specialized sigma24 family protein
MAALTDVDRQIQSAARKVAARYGLDPEDVAQEVYVYALQKPMVQTYLDEGHTGRLAKLFYNAAVDYCEREKRATLGYDWRDDYTYTRPEVDRLLPLALDPTTIPGLSGGALHDGPSAKSDPAYGGGMLASIVDVRAAFGKLGEPDRGYLVLCCALDKDWERIGSGTGMQANSAYARYMRILDRMVTRHLGRKTDGD